MTVWQYAAIAIFLAGLITGGAAGALLYRWAYTEPADECE